jgi:hypothetical protein
VEDERDASIIRGLQFNAAARAGSRLLIAGKILSGLTEVRWTYRDAARDSGVEEVSTDAG